jgi:hypothetical protein
MRSWRPVGRLTVSWRWEVGLPLFVMGALTALAVINVSGAGVIFWVGVVVAGVGAAFFLSGWLGR